MMPISAVVCLAGLLSLQQPAAPKAPESAQPPAQAQPARAAPEHEPKPEEPPVVTHHEIHVGGKRLRYTVTTGFMPLKSESGEVEARMFFVAYALDAAGDPARRPLTISFNGGPGSSSVWLHLGALGPRRVRLQPDGSMPPPPFTLVDNEATWLDQTDLVFVDPVGTGYSRAARPELGKRYWSVQGDIESVGEFIRLYLSRYERWSSPLFMVGESYGTTRAAGLAGYLIDRGIAFNGILLVSSILNFQTAEFTKGNDLPYVLFLPTYTATAWFHKRLEPALQRDLQATLREVEAWASTDYTVALARGTVLAAPERRAVAERLARYTGLNREVVEQNDLRIEIQRFCKSLLRADDRTVGRLDSRFTGLDSSAASERPDFDPSLAAIRPPYTAAFNDYVRRELGFSSDLPYHVLGGGFTSWDWGSADEGFPDTSEALRRALARNPHMRVFVASGYYDLATPYYATEYTLSHLGLQPSLREHVTQRYYEAGHMMYIDGAVLAALRRDVAAFIAAAASGPTAGAPPAR
jgi:carboxypeptidase C (cathepsin A)